MMCSMQHPLLSQNYLNVLSHVKAFLPLSSQLFASLILLQNAFFFPQGAPSSQKTTTLEDQCEMRVEGL